MLGVSCGKVLLVGEHAVVYGHTAVAAGFPPGASAVLSRESARLTISAPSSVPLSAHPSDGSELGAAWSALRRHAGLSDADALGATVELHLPPGAGLGSSAALGVALARALHGWLLEAGRRPALDANEWVARGANTWESVFHGNPSGVDAAAAAWGGCIRFRRGAPVEPLLAGATLPLLLAVAGPPAPTHRMVALVAERLGASDAARVALARLGELGDVAAGLVSAGDLPALGALFDESHEHLRALGVVTDDLDRACNIARSAGARGAKLTGAGGGGAVVALGGAADDAILAAWRSAGLLAFAAPVAASRRPVAPTELAP